MRWLRFRNREDPAPSPPSEAQNPVRPDADPAGLNADGGDPTRASEGIPPRDHGAPPTAEEEEWDWIHRHTVEAPKIIGEFLGGDGISLEGSTVMDLGSGDGLIDWGVATMLRPRKLV